ncbi:MAG: hypothetical protein V4662_12090 [Verrucomicrobiota bacterium]
MPESKITEKQVQDRVPPDLLKRIRAEFKPDGLKLLTQRAITSWPVDAGIAAIRLIQLSGRVPSEADVKHIFPDPAPAADPAETTTP